MMFGPFVLLAASVSPSVAPVPPAVERPPALRSVSRASAQATATIRIISGVSFGADQPKEAPGANRRKAVLADAGGNMRAAEILEFQ